MKPTNINITRTGTIARLKAMGLPALPVAPAQDAQEFPARDRSGEILRQANGQPKPAFTGKNPSYLDVAGNPKLIAHRVFQERLPSDWEMQNWFANPANGVMTMGGWQNVIWIDIDVKRYSSQGRCDRSVQLWRDRYPELESTWIERTHSGGWRFAVQVEIMPEFTNFGFRRGQHIGEILGVGRLTVLAPTIGPSGQPYVSVNRAKPISVKDVKAIGLHTAQATRKSQTFKIIPMVAESGTVSLHELVNKSVRAILAGSIQPTDRSHAITAVARELYGWENWAGANGVPLVGQADIVIAEVALMLGVDADRVVRILATVDRGSCQPAIVRLGGEAAAWKKVKSLAVGIMVPRIGEKSVRSLEGRRTEV
jgi:hypothetical protein